MKLQLEALEERRVLSSAPLLSGIVAWYPGDGNPTDVVGGNNGTLINSPAFLTGEVRQAFSFNGAGQYASVADSPALNPGAAITVEAWVTAQPTGNYQFFVNKFNHLSGPGPDDSYELGLRPDGALRWQVDTLIGSAVADNILDVFPTVSIFDGQFHHFAGTYDGSSMKVYFDGAQVASQAASGTIVNSATPLFLGGALGNGTPGFFQNGMLDEVSIYDRALTGTEIQSIFSAGTEGKALPDCSCCTREAATGVLGWWAAEGNAQDGVGGHNGTISAGVSFGPGEVQQGFQINNGYVSIPGDVSLQTPSVTVDGWIRPSFTGRGSANGRPNDIDTLMAQLDPGVASGYGLFLAMDQAGAYLQVPPGGVPLGTPVFYLVTATSGPQQLFGSSPVPDDGLLHHVAGTYDGFTMALWLDGQIVASRAVSGAIVYPATPSSLVIGGELTSDRLSKATVDEVRVFDHALSASDLQAVVTTGSTGQFAPPSSAGLVSRWSAEGNAADGIDGNNGTLLNGATFATGLIGQAFRLDGVNDHVRVHDATNLDVTGSMTLSVWINPTAGVADIIAKWDAVGVNQRSYVLWIDSSGRPIFSVSPDGQEHNIWLYGTTVVPRNQWTHLVGVYDGSNLKLYMNGNQNSQMAYSQGIFAGTNDLAIGAAVGGLAPGQLIGPFAGMIDEPSLYNRALSAFEIRSLFLSDECASEQEARADLSIAGSDSPDPVAVGGTLTYTLTAHNNGAESATGVSLIDTLPTGTTFVSASFPSGTFMQANGTVTVNLGTLAVGASVTGTITVHVDPTAGATLTNAPHVSANEPDPDSTNNTATISTTVIRLANISGQKFEDHNGNRSQDADDQGLQGWTIYLDNDSNGVLDPGEPSTITDAAGNYQFNGLPAGSYRVREVPQAHWVQTTFASFVNASAGGDFRIDFGNFHTFSVSGQKYEDHDASQTKDAEDQGLGGWTMVLFVWNIDHYQGVISTVTADDGSYRFDDLGPGLWAVDEVQQAGWTRTTAYPQFSRRSGEDLLDADLGNFRHVTVTGRKFNDLDGDGQEDPGEPGIAGWTIFIDFTHNGAPDENEPVFTTGADGSYVMAGLPPGIYPISEYGAPGWTQTYPQSRFYNLVVGGPTGAPSGATVAETDFGNFQFASITGGRKFEDRNGNGLLDLGEPGLANWTIYVDGNGNDSYDPGERFTNTDINGHYAFDRLLVGTYRLREIQQPGWTQTMPNPADIVVTTSGQLFSGPDFGNFFAMTVHGQKFEDHNGNGSQDAGDQGLPGWTIFLDANGNEDLDPGERSTTTDAGGLYAFTGVGPGTYYVREVQQPNWTQTKAHPHPITTASGAEARADFGNFHNLAVTGFKFEDRNGNGVQDPDDQLLANWPINLFQWHIDHFEHVATETTGAGGAFRFADVGPGLYVVREQQAGWTQTTPNPAPFSAASGVDVAGQEFGNFHNISITGRKFEDHNGNGLQDPEDQALPGWAFWLDFNHNGFVEDGEPVAVTDSQGVFTFEHVVGPGSYDLVEAGQPGWQQTTSNRVVTAGPGGAASNTLISGQDFGNFRLATISGQKFNDINGDGLQQIVEHGLKNWTLFLDENHDGGLSAGEPQTLTDDNGFYTLGGLGLGTYSLREAQQPGWLQTTLNPADMVVTASGQTFEGQNFGNTELSTLAGQKFHDLDGDGLHDANELGLDDWTFFLDTNCNGVLDGGETSVETDENGNYRFSRLLPGTYRVREVQQLGWLQTTANPYDVTIAVGGQSYAGGDFGNFLGATITGGQKFNDLNGNGLKEVGEPGLMNWTIFLDANGNDTFELGETFTTTDQQGYYSFTSLRAGSYRVREVQQPGWVQTSPNPPDLVVMASGQDLASGDFGNMSTFQSSRLQGLVWEDFNNDGEVDFGEKAIENVSIRLTGHDDRGAIVDLVMATDSQGVFEFLNLRPSDPAGYTLTETHPTGYVDGREALGTVNGLFSGTASDEVFAQIALATPGSEGVNYNFGERPVATGSVAQGQTATIGFWQNKNGQKLLKTLNGGLDSTQLGHWLAQTFPNLYGATAGSSNLAGKTNVEVAAFYVTLFNRTSSLNGPPKMDAQVLAVAFGVYATNQSLAGQTAAAYGFTVTAAGLGAATFDVGNANRAAFNIGPTASTVSTVLDLLLAVDAKTRNGLLYDGDASGSISNFEKQFRVMANVVFTAINEQGDI